MSEGGLREYDIATTSAADDDEDEEEDYEEPGGGNRFLGFMFGNVDDAGDLDADYLDEDAKDHLFALADQLGPTLKDIDLIKSSSAPYDPSEQDYDEKADDAIDYEDIDEQYDGPEVEAATEEDHLLSKKDYLSSNTMFASVCSKVPVFDEENYDEDEEPPIDIELPDDDVTRAEQLGISPSNDNPATETVSSSLPQSVESMDVEYEVCQEEVDTEEDQPECKSATSLPVLCIEDGRVILKFSEVFGVQEPVRKVKRDQHKQPANKEVQITNICDIAEDDEEAFLRCTLQDVSSLKNIKINEDFIESDSDELISSDTFGFKDFFLSDQPMKDAHKDFPTAKQAPVCPDVYPLEHEDWENGIIWGNSPASETQPCLKSCVISEESSDTYSEDEAKDYGYVPRCCDAQSKNNGSPEPFGFVEMPASASYHSPENSYPPLMKENPPEKNDLDHAEPNNVNETVKIVTMKCLSNLSLLNKELLEGSWLDNIIWDRSEHAPKPKLILDLKDDQMLFEILDEKNGDHLRSHALAMIVSRSVKTSTVENFGHNNQVVTFDGQFNISNDKFYSNREISQQAKSHTKRRSSMGVKVVHSVPAQKLQTMKLNLNIREIANFHRPKAKWYPHENKLAAELQGAACYHGSMTVIVMTLGGKGVKLLVKAEETPLSVKSKASKKLEFRPSEKIKLFAYGKELQDDISFAMQNVRPNSVLHVVRTEVHLWPKAQKLPGEGKALRPPGAFRKRSDLSVKDGHVFLMEYCEERPLLLSNAGMGARLCTYYQKTSPDDQTATSLRSNNDGLGTVLAIEPADKSPFLGDVCSGSHQSCVETNMYRAPAFPHKVAMTDYLLVRSPKGMLSIRRIDKLYAVGQQEPHMEVFAPGTKNLQNYLLNRILVYVYREFRARERPGVRSQIRADEIPIEYPLTEFIVRKRLKHCADLEKGPTGHLFWRQRADFRIPSEDELRRLLSPESVCCHESMQAGKHRLVHLGIHKLKQPVGLASAMNKLPDKAIELAAAAHIERELQITSWNLTSNFVACINQDRENMEKLEISGIGDPSGRGLGFSYVRVTPVSNSSHKKKPAAARNTTVTGTDADLRRLSMDTARELLLKFGVPDEQIDKLTRWHRIAMVRKLSSEQAASGIMIDEIPVSKFARGQGMSFLQLHHQAKEKCQEIWDRQVRSLSAIDGDDNGSDTEAHSDLDSFAGDLENLLDAEEFDDEDVGTADLRGDKGDDMRGLKMRKCSTQAQLNEENQDDQAEAALVKKLLEENGNDTKRKIQPVEMTNYGTSMYSQGANKMKQSKVGQMIKSSGYASALTIEESTPRGAKEERSQGAGGNSIVCGACGKLGHMRTNKLCANYGEDPETSGMDVISYRANKPLDEASHVQTKTPGWRLVAKVSSEAPEIEGPESIRKIPVKFRFGTPEKSPGRNMSVAGSLVSDRLTMDANDLRSTGKVSMIKIFSKTKSEDYSPDTPKPSIMIRLPAKADKDAPRKKVIVKQPQGHVDQLRTIETRNDQGPRKLRKISELSSFEENSRENHGWYAGEPGYMNSSHDRLLLSGNRKSKEVVGRDESWSASKEQRERQEQRLIEARIYEVSSEEELQKSKRKIKKKKRHEFRDADVLDHKPYKNDRRVPERDRAEKRRAPADMTEYAPSAKRRRGGEVELSNILVKIVDHLRNQTSISLLFLKPVTKKVAPDYYDVIQHPMDLGTIRDKARKMEYKNREEFWHDVAQIVTNAHIYNDTRHPHIPPLAEQLLKLCDNLLEESADVLDAAESAIEC